MFFIFLFQIYMLIAAFWRAHHSIKETVQGPYTSQYKFTVVLYDKVVAQCLRQTFRNKWNYLYPNMPWKDDITSFNSFMKLEKDKARAKHMLGNTGDCNAWDLSGLFYALLSSDSIGKMLRKQTQQTAYDAIDKLRMILNAHCHSSSSTCISRTSLQIKFIQIENCLKELGYHNAYKNYKSRTSGLWQKKSGYDCFSVNSIDFTVLLVIIIIFITVVTCYRISLRGKHDEALKPFLYGEKSDWKNT